MNSNLLSILDELDSVGDEYWMPSLSPRKLKELEFHDKDRDRKLIEDRKATDTFEKFYGNKKYYAATKRSSSYVENWIKQECQGRVFLDYACGNGTNAIKAAKSGASLSIGIDISSVSVKNARETAIIEDIGNVRFVQADAERTRLPDNSVDRIVCSGVLHHLDLSYAYHELRRILKPGGKILAVEALDYNPAIKFYRALTPAMRTDWEKAHILSLKDIRFAQRFFDVGDVKYWHVVGYAAGKFPVLSKPLEAIDRLLESIPYVQLMAWIFTFELIKGAEK